MSNYNLRSARNRKKDDWRWLFHAFFNTRRCSKLADEASFQIGDMAAEINGLSHGAGFLLFVKQGLVYMLEGYTYDEPWHRIVHSFDLHYNGTSERK